MLKKIITVFSEKEMIIGTTIWLDMCFSYGSGDCCGSGVNFGDTIPASSFMRQTEGPTFYVNQGLSGMRDMVPPCRDVKEWICCLPHQCSLNASTNTFIMFTGSSLLIKKDKVY